MTGPLNYAQIEAELSPERLSTYAGGDAAARLAQYARNIRLSEALYPSLQTLEIVLRNHTAQALTRTYGAAWYFNQVLATDVPSRTWIILRDTLAELGRQQQTVTPGAVVASLSFGFWTHWYSKRHEMKFYIPHHTLLLPHAPRRRRGRSYVQGELEMIRDLRNRVAHHEPILNSPTLLADYGRVITLLGDLSPDVRRWLEESRLDRFPETARR